MSNKHAGTAAAGTQAAIPEPSFAERARTLLHLSRVGNLSTHSRKRPGFPFGSVMPFALDGQGRPIFLISSMAMHTQNLQQDAARQPAGDPGGSGRRSARCSPGDRWLEICSVARRGVGGRRGGSISNVTRTASTGSTSMIFPSSDGVLDVYYVGGFGVMGWVAASGILFRRKSIHWPMPRLASSST